MKKKKFILYPMIIAVGISSSLYSSAFGAVIQSRAAGQTDKANIGQEKKNKDALDDNAKEKIGRNSCDNFTKMSDTTASDGNITERPDGDLGGNPPERPDGDLGGNPPEKPDGDEQSNKESKTFPFNDVASDMWYYNSISAAYNMGLISGISENSFSPAENVTGAQLLTMLYRASGNTSAVNSGGNWYDTYVEWAKENKILTDDMGWNFQPTENLAREQMIVIVYNYLIYSGIEFTEESDLSDFTDKENLSDYAKKAAKYLVGAGIISGSGSELNPKNTLTRAETATILVNAIGNKKSGQKDNNRFSDKPDADMPGEPPEKPDGSSFGGSGEINQGGAATTISEDGTYENETYTSSSDDENALRIDAASASFNKITVNKTAGESSNKEDGDFYGMNAAVLAANGATVTIKNSEINSSAQNGNGVFSYGNGTTVNISDCTITTSSDNSGGIQTTGGGATNAENLTINTSGDSSAAIRSDRGGGTVSVNKGSYTSNGYNSPAVYSTADITVSNAELTANNSEALVIEGKNSITLNNCSVSGNMSDSKGASSDENVHNIMIYQSMSGDAEIGTSAFNMIGGSITGNNGDMFYVTNTHCKINLSDADIVNKSDAYLMRICGNSASHGWGNAGENGAQAEVTAQSQNLNGDIIVDSISTLDLTLSDGTVFNGTINIYDNEQGGEEVSDNAVVSIDESSEWNLTGNCVITSLDNNGTINYNGYTITLSDGTVLE